MMLNRQRYQEIKVNLRRGFINGGMDYDWEICGHEN